MGVFPGGLRPPDPLTRGLCPLDSHQGTPLDPFWGEGSRPPPKPPPSRGVSHPPAPPGSQRFTRPLNFFTQKLCSQPSVQLGLFLEKKLRFSVIFVVTGGMVVFCLLILAGAQEHINVVKTDSAFLSA